MHAIRGPEEIRQAEAAQKAQAEAMINALSYNIAILGARAPLKELVEITEGESVEQLADARVAWAFGLLKKSRKGVEAMLREAKAI